MHVFNPHDVLITIPSIKEGFDKPKALELWAASYSNNCIRLISYIVTEWELQLLKERELLYCLLNSFIRDTQAWDEAKAFQTRGPAKIAQWYQQPSNPAETEIMLTKAGDQLQLIAQLDK